MNKQNLLDLIQYIISKTIALKNKYIEEKDSPIDYLSIFSHSQEEFSKMKNIADEIGTTVQENNGPTYLLKKPIDTPVGKLKLIRIRIPDLTRPQKGDADFRVNDFAGFKQKYVGKFDNHITLTKRPDYELIEIKNEVFDVLAYFPSIPLSQELLK